MNEIFKNGYLEELQFVLLRVLFATLVVGIYKFSSIKLDPMILGMATGFVAMLGNFIFGMVKNEDHLLLKSLITYLIVFGITFISSAAIYGLDLFLATILLFVFFPEIQEKLKKNKV